MQRYPEPYSTDHGRTVEDRMKLLTIKEVCSRLAVSRSKLYELIRSHQLQTFRIGKRGVRVSEAELTRFITEGETR